ncbi:MAG: hypothetical protein GF383_13920, partial [Candidatus Lokiarchaeota archaeon]|nr:hypothetical protein [Candidatus Lokiarchaeota archaeon]MBD3342403.1 hypothetical protein [Candidatus Lokiarchaeota archaeon]
MTEQVDKDNIFMERLIEIIREGKLDEAVEKIAFYLNESTEENYIDRLENIIETVLSVHGGRTVIRFLIENMIIDIPSLLSNLSKKDNLLRYSFLLLLKPMCENEADLFIPYTEELLEAEDPNVREAILQLLLFIAGGEKKIESDELIKNIGERLDDEKDFVVQKAKQALKSIGKESSALIAKLLRDFAKQNPENEQVKNNVDDILKAIVSVEKIDEIVEEETEEEKIKKEKEKFEAKDETKLIPKEKDVETVQDLEKEEEEIHDKELQLKKKEIEIKKKKLELKEKEKELEEKEIEEKEKELKKKEEEIKSKESKVEAPKTIEKEEEKIIDKELELKKKEIELKKKKLELDAKEKELEEKAIEEREKELREKEELKEKDLKTAE